MLRVEIKRAFPMFFLVAVSLLVTLGIASLPPPSFNVVGAIAYSPAGVKVGGYAFNFYGQGVPVTINVSIEGFHEIVKSNNGTFLVNVHVLFPNGSTLVVCVTHGKEKYVTTEVLVKDFITFANASMSYSVLNYDNVSMVYVKGETVVATFLKCIYVNGEKVPVNSTVFVVNSDNVRPPFGEYSLSDSQIVGKCIYTILTILGVNMGIIILTAYSYLSVFPRKQLELIMRLKGISKVFLSKMLVMLAFSSLLSFPSLLIFSAIRGIFLSSALHYVLVVIMYSLAVYGISPLVNSKELVYSSIVIAWYLLGSLLYNTFNLFFLLFPLVGLFKLWWVYRR
ncbi:hypothetical protein [Acidianus sp. HS-5]|uniref:hypothetical protein n=1 Tax=Acidianus sp. HS-5 TaxID=2886040 RepID=UPI001F19A837|nr:hypothetical protein [Acidianus sp. HS-5]BDC18782.1 hypothetical protein HS5_16720 [Acidianus sp. HS-5]